MYKHFIKNIFEQMKINCFMEKHFCFRETFWSNFSKNIALGTLFLCWQFLLGLPYFQNQKCNNVSLILDFAIYTLQILISYCHNYSTCCIWCLNIYLFLCRVSSKDLMFEKPKNLFLINSDVDASNALSFVKGIHNKKNKGIWNIIITLL